MKKTTKIIAIIAASLVALLTIIEFLRDIPEDLGFSLIAAVIFTLPFLILWLFNRTKNSTKASNLILLISIVLIAVLGVSSAYIGMKNLHQADAVIRNDMDRKEAAFSLQIVFLFIEGFIAVLAGITALVINKLTEKSGS